MAEKGKATKNIFTRFVIVILILLFVMANLFIYLFMEDVNERGSEVYIEVHSRIPISMLLGYPNFNSELISFHKKEMKSILFLDEQGNELYQYGENSKNPLLSADEDVVHFDKNQSLVIIDIQRRLILKNRNSELFEGKLNYFEERHFYIHMEIHDPDFIRNYYLTLWIQRGIQFIIFILFILSVFLFLRLQKMGKFVERQKNLATLGGALRTLTHEMKNPLSAIKLQAVYIKKKYPQIPEEELSVFNSEISRLTRLMDTVRNYLKDPVGEPERLNMTLFFDDLKQYYPQDINWYIPSTAIYINFDRDRFRSIMENLINNAIESGSDMSGIEISFRLTGKIVSVSVKDKGKGIPKEMRKKIFDPFYTTKSKGSGAGLMIVERFLSENNVKLLIESEMDKGTEFSFQLKAFHKENK